MSNSSRAAWRILFAQVVGIVFVSFAIAQPPPPPPQPATPAAGGDNAQELTRGPIHEAFGQPTVFNPEAGPIVPKKPPELIDEIPPDQKPEGDNVGWIPGYWGWDDEAKNYLWVSGFWRTVPPSRVWMPGYWNAADGGYQWVSGYWGPAQATEAEYLPPPPESLEAGPSTEATEENQVWIPGVWVWKETRFWWRPGFWTAANPNWVWVPAQNTWTPSGYVFVDGYWDFPLFNRGLLFAPVVFNSIPARFTFTPSVVIDTQFLAGALFARPAYSHYYFGDYYDPAYSKAGIYPWYAFHNSRFGHDSLYAQTSFVYSRRDPQWTERVRETFLTRRENQTARPPHTYRQFVDWARKADPDGRQSVAFARPLTEVQGSRDFPMRLERLDERRAATIRAQSQQVQKFRSERIRVEQEAGRELPRTGTTTDPKAPRAPGRTAPTRVKLPEAPRLSQTPPGIGGKTAPPAGAGTGTTGRASGPPDSPRVPELTPPRAGTATAPKETRRPLPHPDENLRPPAGAAAPKGRIGDPAPMPPPPKTAAPPHPMPPPAAKEPPKGPPAAPPKGPKKDKD
jgi:WXXGXW repeat (2 copies)